jgi:hypothetical protein
MYVKKSKKRKRGAREAVLPLQSLLLLLLARAFLSA